MYLLITCLDEELDAVLFSSQELARQALHTLMKERHSDIIKSLMDDALQDELADYDGPEDEEPSLDDNTVYARLLEEVFPTNMTDDELNSWMGAQLIWDTWSIKHIPKV